MIKLSAETFDYAGSVLDGDEFKLFWYLQTHADEKGFVKVKKEDYVQWCHEPTVRNFKNMLDRMESLHLITWIPPVDRDDLYDTYLVLDAETEVGSN